MQLGSEEWFLFAALTAGLILFRLVSYTKADIKIWTPNTNYNNSNNWSPKRLPSETDSVVFPFDLNVEVMMGSDVSISELILPYSGDILLPTDGLIQINSHESDSKNMMNFVRKNPERWENPSNWRSRDRNVNVAIPHAFQIPCVYDDVIFPPSSTFAVKLPTVPITMRSIQINNMGFDSQEFNVFMDSVMGRRQFIKEDEDPYPIVSGIGCLHPDSGCSCETKGLLKRSCKELSSSLCSIPKCLDPVKPIGHCCDICGVVLQLKFDRTKFKISELNKVLDSYIRSTRDEKDVELVYHAGKTDSYSNLQIVLMEKHGYEGEVTDMADELQRIILSDEKLGLSLLKTLLAGDPYDPSGGSPVFKITFALLIMVVVIVLCYIMYQSDINFGDFFSSSTFTNFVRFENSTGEVELRYEIQPKLRKSFHNPLFQTSDRIEENTKADSELEEIPSTSFSHVGQEAGASESKEESDAVELGEIPPNKPTEESEERTHDLEVLGEITPNEPTEETMHDIDLLGKISPNKPTEKRMDDIDLS